ncbi:hypothetical protein ACNKHP_22040 [Shigella boydii]
MTSIAPVATVNGSYSQSSTISRLERVFQGASSPVGGVNLANRLSETFAVMMRQELKMLMSMGKNIAQQIVMEW